MPEYTDTEQRNLDVVRQFFSESPAPADKSELFTDDGVWWNGLPHINGDTEHRGATRSVNCSRRRGPPSSAPARTSTT